MLALQITSLKKFMGQLLATDTFDCFLLEEAMVKGANTFSIDGRIHKDFYTEEELEANPSLLSYEFRPWSEMKGLCFDCIKGKRTPLAFRFVLHLKPEQATSLLERNACSVASNLVKALAITIRFDGTKATVTTGTAFTTFLPSKEPDAIWDKAVQKFFDEKGIDYKEPDQ